MQQKIVAGVDTVLSPMGIENSTRSGVVREQGWYERKGGTRERSSGASLGTDRGLLATLQTIHEPKPRYRRLSIRTDKVSLPIAEMVPTSKPPAESQWPG